MAYLKTFWFWFERWVPTPKHQIPTSQTHIVLSLDNFAEMAISYKGVSTNKNNHSYQYN